MAIDENIVDLIHSKKEEYFEKFYQKIYHLENYDRNN